MIRAHKNVNEESAAYVTAYYYSKTGVAVTPDAIRYRIDDVTDGLPGNEILTWTAVTPSGTSSEIIVTAEQNSMLNSGQDVERRQVTVEATGTDGQAWREIFEYQLVNLAGTT